MNIQCIVSRMTFTTSTVSQVHPGDLSQHLEGFLSAPTLWWVPGKPCFLLILEPHFTVRSQDQTTGVQGDIMYGMGRPSWCVLLQRLECNLFSTGLWAFSLQGGIKDGQHRCCLTSHPGASEDLLPSQRECVSWRNRWDLFGSPCVVHFQGQRRCLDPTHLLCYNFSMKTLSEDCE